MSRELALTTQAMPDFPDNPVHLVCFDLGNVLVKLAGTWVECCRQVGVPEFELFGDDEDPVLAQAAYDFDTGAMELEPLIRFIRARFPAYQPEHITAVLDVQIQGLFPGVPELIEDIRNAGVRTACLSNTNARHWDIMTGGGEYAPLQKLGHLFASHLIGARKPEERIYRHVEDSLGIPGKSIVFFDDRSENIAAAEARRWRACKVSSKGDPVTQIRRFLREQAVL